MLRNRDRVRSAVAVLTILACAAVTSANVRLPHVFTEHMVLQCDKTVPVWGFADPGEPVTVDFAGQSVSTKADAAGHWQVQLAALKTNAQSQVLTVEGKNKLEIRDVLVGEVWLCAGQSNMAYTLSATTNGADAISKANNPLLRMIRSAPDGGASQPRDDFHGQWNLDTHRIAANSSAVAYFFGRDMVEHLKVPIGLIIVDWSGTRIQPWIPLVGLKAVPQLRDDVKWVQAQGPIFEQMKKAALPPATAWLTKAQAAAKANQPIPNPPAWPINPIAVNHQNLTAIYNAQVAPLTPYAVRGMIWYQGESNVGDGAFYFYRLQGLIRGWRTVFQNPDMPVGIVQLAPFDDGLGNPMQLPKMWEAQARAAKEIPHVGLAVITDHGTLFSVHPPDKEPVGHRLALWALGTVYGKDVVYSGPVYDHMQVQGDAIRVHFTQVDGGLQASDGKPLRGWMIAGQDHVFVPATATIDGEDVIVQSEKVAHPTTVRFGWDFNTAPMNFINKAGLPASPFETDQPDKK